MKIPNADYLERTGERESRRTALAVAAQECKHVAQAYPRRGILFCAGRRGFACGWENETLTVPKYGGVLVRAGFSFASGGFNDTDAEVLWFIVESRRRNLNFCPAHRPKPDMSLHSPG